MDHNRAAAEAWLWHIDTIQRWVDEMDAALGDRGDDARARARATEVALFTPAEQGTDWVQSAASGDALYYWQSSRAHELRLSRLSLGAGAHAISPFDRPPPRVWLRGHQRHLENSIDALNKAFAGPEDQDFFDNAIRRLRRRYVELRDGLLTCALPAWAEAVRLRHDARLARARQFSAHGQLHFF